MKEASVHGNGSFIVRRRSAEMPEPRERALNSPVPQMPPQRLTAKRCGRRRSRPDRESILSRIYDKLRY
jgi:hypothetical protein